MPSVACKSHPPRHFACMGKQRRPLSEGSTLTTDCDCECHRRDELVPA